MNLILVYFMAVALLSTVHAEIKDDTASNALNLFGLKFLAETSNRIPDDINLVVSPYTVWTAMSIVNEGAGGNTAQQLERTLFVPPNGTDRQPFRQLQQRLLQQIAQKNEGVTLEVLNSIFTKLEATLNPDYVNLVRDVYGVKVEALDFKNPVAAADRINKVVSDATKGRVPQVVNPDTVKDTYMFVTSALFFKGLWDKKFDKRETRPAPFYNENKQAVGNVDMMHTNGAFPFGSILNGKAVAVELPYIGNKVSMVAILPAQGVHLSTVLESLAEVPIARLVEDLNRTREEHYSATDVMVRLPKFKIASTLNLNAVLHAMGVVDAFNQNGANFSGIAAGPLFVSRVLHKAEVEVDEEGTIGSSATVVEISDRISDVEYFKADRPFAFVVYDKISKTVVFAGKFVTPTSASSQ